MSPDKIGSYLKIYNRSLVKNSAQNLPWHHMYISRDTFLYTYVYMNDNLQNASSNAFAMSIIGSDIFTWRYFANRDYKELCEDRPCITNHIQVNYWLILLVPKYQRKFN